MTLTSILKRTRLNNAGFVSSGDEVSPGAQYVHELRDKMQKQQIHCLFYEAPERPPLVNTLMRGLAGKALELDAMGISYTAGEDTWLLIMDKIADAFNACL